jgi:hypothetical protein
MLIVCLVLEFGVLSGVPMRVRGLEELMDQLRQLKTAHMPPEENKDGDDPLVKSDNQIE